MPSTDWRRQMRLAGPFQQLVMIALVRLGQDTSAAGIRREIQARTGRRISISAVHTTLQRLARRGYTRSWSRPVFRLRPYAPEEWKRCSASMLALAARRFHTLLTLGRRALRLTLQAEDVLRNGLPGLGRETERFCQGPGSRLPGEWADLPLNRRLRRRLDYGIDPPASLVRRLREAACRSVGRPAGPSVGRSASG